jgi:putative GTP pyrophosphokinase
MTEVSKSQIDRLGQRLVGTPTPDDLQFLATYRQSFQGPLKEVADLVGKASADLPRSALSARPAKSTVSIIRKLQRESIRLSQMQDIAGCRLVVSTIDEQDAVVQALVREHPGWSVYDRRARPSYGYRAVHVVATVGGKPIEIQVRTAPQHGWAEYSETLDRVAHGDVKYGGGPADVRESLDRLSDIVARLERGEPPEGELSLGELLASLGIMLIGIIAQRRRDDK